MMVPGSNLLALALRTIHAQPVQLFRFVQNVDQPNGNDAPTYAAPCDILGSVQAVNQDTVVRLGLDWNKRYVKLFTSADIHDVSRNNSPDVFEFCGRYYSAAGQVDWIQVDGWNEILGVEIPPLTAAQVAA